MRKEAWIANYTTVRAFLAYNHPDDKYETDTPEGKNFVYGIVLPPEAAKAKTKHESLQDFLRSVEFSMGTKDGSNVGTGIF